MENTLCIYIPYFQSFFLAKNHKDLLLCAQSLIGFTNIFSKIPPIPINLDFIQEEYCFNRLFVGPMSIKAPLYASCYLENEPRLMAKSTLEIRELIHALALENPYENSIPDDHIAFELEIYKILKQNQEHPSSKQALNWLFHEHMCLWIPKFIKNAQGETNTIFVSYMISLLNQWIITERSVYEPQN